MKLFLRLYRWSMRMKLHMAMYTFAAVFLKVMYNLIQGVFAVQSIDLLTMWLMGLALAVIESALLPENTDWSAARSVVWLAAANVLFVGGAACFHWFPGVPLWGALVLILITEMGLGMMWFGNRFVLRIDSAELTRQLKQYQQGSRQG